MKSFLQLFLITILLVLFTLFYKSYFVQNNNIEQTLIEKPLENEILNQNISIKQNETPNNQKNLITNLTYNVELSNSGKYEIKSASSEVAYENGLEIVIMRDVSAIFTDNKNNKILITSDFASFNSSNYNTYFKENIKIQYENHIITSNKIDFDFTGNTILIYEDVVYTDIKKKIVTDNIKINLITKKVEFYMNDKNENIRIISK